VDRAARGAERCAVGLADRRRWKVERLFAWLHNFRRLVTRWERHVDNFVGMLHFACARILLRHL
jgi:transposase